jgi:hypothetical protein
MATAAIGAPAECDFERRRGDTKDIAIRLTQDGAVIASAEGYSALLTINVSKAPTDTTGQIFQATGVPNSPATDAILRFDFASFAIQSPEIVPGGYFYDIQITDPEGEIHTPQVGKFKVVQDITK